jgi:hypothetical protein
LSNSQLGDVGGDAPGLALAQQLRRRTATRTLSHRVADAEVTAGGLERLVGLHERVQRHEAASVSRDQIDNADQLNDRVTGTDRRFGGMCRNEVLVTAVLEVSHTRAA